MSNRALIIGASSQDGSFLADLLLEKGYTVAGTIRRTTSPTHENIRHLYGKIHLYVADLLDSVSIAAAVEAVQPHEVYNLASQSVPADSWSQPLYTGEVTALGAVRVAEAIRSHAPEARLYQATTREIFGNIQAEFANESTAFDANNPYGIAKAYSHMMVRSYRESYGMYACGGILFNHESERRSLHFVTRKITVAVACIRNKVAAPPIDELGRPLIDSDGKLHLGFLDAARDWGYAKDYVEAMWLMLQRNVPKDYVIGTGATHSVRDVCRLAFERVGLDWEDHVVSDSALYRPTEIKELKGDASLAKAELGWTPTTSFEDLICRMVDSDVDRFR